MSEEAAVGTPVGAIMAAAVNQTIVYSIIEGNEGGEYAPSFLYAEQCLLKVSAVDLADR